MNTRAIIFDMDGLLIDSEPLWREAEIEIFNALGVPLTIPMCLQTMGFRIDEVVEYWHERYPWSGDSKKKVTKKLLDRMAVLIHERGHAMPGVEKAFALARDMKCKIAIASSSHEVIIRAVREKLQLPDIDVAYSAEHEKYGKPHPGVYITTAKKLGISPLLCVAVEDSVNGVIAAKAAKMHCIAVPDALVRGKKEFCVADAVLDSLDQMTKELFDSLKSKV